MASINHKTVQGVDVFNVGKKQAWILFNWKGCASDFMDYSTSVASSASCQSMAKGRWLVVACSTVFGGGSFGHRVRINWDGKTLREALDWAKWYQEHGTVYEADDIVSRTHVTEYEIWHLVDDGELWQTWDQDSAIVCKDIQQEDNFHLYDGCKCVLDLGRYVPDTVYVITYIRDWNNDSIDRADWYNDAYDWVDAIGNAACNGIEYLTIERQTADELGLYVVDDWEMDEGLADGMTVLNAYFRLSVA